MAAINQAPAGLIAMVYGPTGVGKTTVRLKVQQLLAEQSLSQMNTDRAVCIRGGGSRRPRQWNFQLKKSFSPHSAFLNENISAKGQAELHASYTRLSWEHLLGPRSSAVELRHTLKCAVLRRRPAAILVDEAQRLTRIASGRRLANQLKMSSVFGQLHTDSAHLDGTYDLLPL